MGNSDAEKKSEILGNDCSSPGDETSGIGFGLNEFDGVILKYFKLRFPLAAHNLPINARICHYILQLLEPCDFSS
jgi:hypothetical protein